MMDTSLTQPILAEQTAIHIQDNSGQIAIGNYIVQIGSVHGGVVNIAMPEQQPRPRLRPTPIMLRPRRFQDLLDRKIETSLAAETLPTFLPVEFYGQAGLGKTSLLRHLAHHLSPAAWPDGIIYLSAGRQPLADLLQFLFDAFYESDIPFKPTAAQIRHALQQKQALILLDDLSLDRTELEALMDAAPDCSFLLTSADRRLWGEGRAVALQGLPPGDALALLERGLNRTLSADEQQAAPALCATLRGHPLFLLQVAALIRDDFCSLVEMADRLKQDEPDKALAGQIVASLSGPEHQVIGLLAAMAGAPLHAEHLAGLTGLDNPVLLLENLIERNLVQAHSPRYSLTVALDPTWTQSWDLSLLSNQILTFLTRWAEGGRQTPARLLEEMESFRHILAWAANAGRWQEVLRLGRAIEEALALAGRWTAWEQTLRQMLQAAEAVGNQAARAWALHQLGTRALCLEDFITARAALRQALGLREMLGDQAGAAVTRHNLNLLPPPGASGREPAEQPPSSTPSSSVSPSTMELAASAVLMSGILSLVILLAALVGAPFLPRNWFNRTAASPTAALVAFVTLTPTPVAVTPSLTPAAQLSAPTSTSTATPSATSTPTFTVTPTSTPTQPPPSPEEPTACSPPSGWVIYIVQSGDNLDSLAIRTNSTVFELQQANCLANNILYVGQALYLPQAPATPTATHTPTRLPPQIISVNPSSGERETQVTIMVEGYYFEPDDPDFSVELIGNGAGAVLNLGSLRASTAFEAIVPSTLPAGSYDLLVVNPDGELAVRSAAYRVIERPPSITPEPELALRPDRLTFPEQRVNTNSETETVTLANFGAGQLRLDEISLTGLNPDDFTVTHNCPVTLAPAARCDLRVRFRPAAAGERSADLNILSNAPGTPHVVLLSGIGQPGQPDLIVMSLEVTGPVFFGQENEPNVPVRAVIRNEGDGAASPFKVAAIYIGGNISPDTISVAAFRAQPTDQVDPGNGFYPFTRQELLTGEEVMLEGMIIFHPRERDSTVSLQVVADSCRGDENQPDFCRVAESNETNNESAPVSVPIFGRID